MTENTVVKEIDITEFEGLKIGNATDDVAKTGITVMLFDEPAIGGVDVSGGGPASRETPLLSPLTASNPLNALVLSGGSAYGLDASAGVMKYLEEHGIGFETHFAKVPLVCHSCIYDLGYGATNVRPDLKMGYEACENAQKNVPTCGNVGAGAGASVGKLYGMKQAEKSGLGIYAVQLGDLKVAAVVSVNAFGDIFDHKTGEKIAGLMNAERTEYLNMNEEFYKMNVSNTFYRENTTIGAIITNGKFAQDEMNKIAAMTRSAYARSINPVATMADGDTIYAVSMGKVKADINLVGTLAAEVMSMAIEKAVRSSKISDEEFLKNCGL